MEEIVCLHRKNCVKKSKRPLDEVGDQKQCSCFSNYMEATSTKEPEENVSFSKLLEFCLKKKYFQNKEVNKYSGTRMVQLHLSSTPLQVVSAIFENGEMLKRIYRHLSFVER